MSDKHLGDRKARIREISTATNKKSDARLHFIVTRNRALRPFLTSIIIIIKLNLIAILIYCNVMLLCRRYMRTNMRKRVRRFV